jgi:hypothetical protein
MCRHSQTTQILFEEDARKLSQAWKASRKKYEAVELLLKAEAERRCAHHEALDVIMRVNDASGHVINGNIPFERATNYLKAVPPFDLTKLLRAMRRQTSRAALRVQKTDRASQLSDEKLISDKAKLTSQKKRRQGMGARNAKREARDQWIYDRCLNWIPYKMVMAKLSAICQMKGWDKITTIQGIRSAAMNYAERHHLPKIPSRQDL